MSHPFLGASFGTNRARTLRWTAAVLTHFAGPVPRVPHCCPISTEAPRASSRVHMFLEARRGAVLPRRVPSRTSSVVLVDALRQRTSPRCLARTPAPCEQARPSSSVLCDRADNSGSYAPAGSVGTSHSPWRPEWAVEGRVAADAAIACAMLQASGLRIPMSLAHSQQSTVDLGKSTRQLLSSGRTSRARARLQILDF